MVSFQENQCVPEFNHVINFAGSTWYVKNFCGLISKNDLNIYNVDAFEKNKIKSKCFRMQNFNEELQE